jgi:hypothetical protein
MHDSDDVDHLSYGVRRRCENPPTGRQARGPVIGTKSKCSMDRRLLAIPERQLGMVWRTLGQPAIATCRLGAGALDRNPQRMGVEARALAKITEAVPQTTPNG